MKLRDYERWSTMLRDRYQTFSVRERGLVLLALLALTWLGWAATLGGYLGGSHERMSVAVQGMSLRVQSEVAEQARLETARAQDPNARLLRERERLDARLAATGESLATLLDRFVDPETMPALLEDVIRHHRGLKLTRMESLPAEPIAVSDHADAGDPGALWIYRHPLRLELEGSYFDVLAYLAELERSPWEFGWRQLRYQVREYPVAEVTLEIETLSRDRSWIGV